MDKKKKPSLWFEEPIDDFKRAQDSFFENIEKVFSRPNVLGRIIKFPDFKTNFIPVKIGETDRELLLRAHLPGFAKEDIRLKVTPNLAYISVETKKARIDRGENFFKHEKSVNSASRILELPTTVITDGVKARYKDGVLEVVMKKKSKNEREVRVE